MPPDLALSSILIGSNYPCLELIFMVPKVFEPLKFDCIKLPIPVHPLSIGASLNFCGGPKKFIGEQINFISGPLTYQSTAIYSSTGIEHVVVDR